LIKFILSPKISLSPNVIVTGISGFLKIDNKGYFLTSFVVL
jgi:hypothetical protein